MNNIKNLVAFVSPSNIKPELHRVLVTPHHIVATDAFKLIEIEHDNETLQRAEPVLVELPQGVKTFDNLSGTGHDGTIVLTNKGASYKAIAGSTEMYPKYEQVVAELEATPPVISIELNAKMLKEIAEAFSAKQRVTLTLYGEDRAIKFTAPGIKALLMPMRK